MTPQPVLHATTAQGEKITLCAAEPHDVDAIYATCHRVAAILPGDLA